MTRLSNDVAAGGIDYRHLSDSALDKIIQRAESQKQENLGKARISAKAAMAELAAKAGFTVEELLGNQYRNPDNSSETWSGRGARPKWLKAKLNEGYEISDFEEGASPPTTQTKASQFFSQGQPVTVAQVKKAKKAKKSKVQHRRKYQNPDNPIEVYGGYGPRPQWLKLKLAQGLPLENMQI